MSIQGVDSYIYWGRSTTYKGGDPSSDKHQPFNPLLEFSNPLVHYTQEHITTCDKLEPNIVYDKQLELGTTTVKAHFRDPFAALTMFGYKALPTSWTGTGDNILANMSNLDNRDKNIWVQVHAHDQSGGGDHLNMLFDGGDITSYKFLWEQGKAVEEEYELKFAEASENTQAVDIDDGFDDGSFDADGLDGGWSNWDGAYDASKGQVALSNNITCTWNDAALDGIAIQKGSFEIGFPKEPYYVASALTAAGSIIGKLAPHKCVLEGKLLGNDEFSEFLAAYSSKTKGTLKVQYGTTKFFQFTNAYIFQIDPPGGLPPAGEAQDVSYVILGGANSAISYSWTANEATDPGDHINHTNV